MLGFGVDCFMNSPGKKWAYSVNQVRFRFIFHRSCTEAWVAIYLALLLWPETSTFPATPYRPSLVLSRQKKAGSGIKETVFLTLSPAEACRASRPRRAHDSA